LASRLDHECHDYFLRPPDDLDVRRFDIISSFTSGMSEPPEGLEIGDRFTQQEIEDEFDTGFGYQISGINPRRDEQDRRYILLFSNEDGPYEDSVVRGQFEYIGEGLSGDQSESSPGNSSLIDAITSAIPIHFFYQDSGDGNWEYRGLVDVLGYQIEERGGRQVLVFSMEHRSPDIN
jgi:putative restriction endonuclease